jgi:hypothetical protein
MAVVAAVAAALFVLWFVLRFAKGAALSRDPRQHELAALMLNAIAEGHAPKPEKINLVKNDAGEWKMPEGLPRNFISCWQDVTAFVNVQYAAMGLGERRTRLAQALAMAQPLVSSDDYSLLRDMVMGYRG